MQKTVSTMMVVAFISVLLFSAGMPHMEARQGQTTEPDFSTARLERRLKQQMKKQEIPGLVVMVVQGDEIVYLTGIGEDPPDPEAAFDMGRMADVFISTSLMMQVEQEKIVTANQVVDYLPDFLLADINQVPRINVYRLLTHSAGLGSAPLAPIEPLAAAGFWQVEVTQTPGVWFSYCTRCYALMVDLLEQLTGEKAYADMLTDDIFYPLHMDDTRVRNDRIFSTPADLAHFMSVNLQKGRYQNIQLVKPESIEALHGAYFDTYRLKGESIGYGWWVHFEAGLDTLENSDDRIVSAIDMGDFRAHMTLIPAYKTGILLVSSQPTTGLDNLMAIALDEVAGWTPREYTSPEDRSLTGYFVSAGETDNIIVRFSEEDDEVFEVEYADETALAERLDEYTLAFDLAGQRYHLHYLVDDGRISRTVLSQNGETLFFYRLS